MAKDVTRKGHYGGNGVDRYVFTGYLYLSPGGGMRHTKTEGACREGERVCLVKVEVPAAAFEEPQFKVEVAFDGGAPDADPTRIVQEIEGALSALPVTVEVVEQELVRSDSSDVNSSANGGISGRDHSLGQ